MITVKEIFCLNEQGKRTNNEDCIAPRKGSATLKERLFIVCDGVGGENKGEVASELVCDAVYKFVHDRAGAQEVDETMVSMAITKANAVLASYVQENSSSEGMSTTIALIYVGKERVLAAWCGDTRIHQIRDGRIIWKSRDHSLVSELVNSGEITEAEGRVHPRRNVITRSLNARSFNSQIDSYQIYGVHDGDCFLLCTDGLLEQIDDDRLYAVLTSKAERNYDRAFQAYCEGKTRDNYSMYLVKVGVAGKTLRNKTLIIAIMLVLLVVIFSYMILVLL